MENSIADLKKLKIELEYVPAILMDEWVDGWMDGYMEGWVDDR